MVTAVTVTAFVESIVQIQILSRVNINARKYKYLYWQGEKSIFSIELLYPNCRLPIPQRLRAYTQSETYSRTSYLPKQQADILAIIAKFCPVDDVKFDHYVIDWDFD